MKRRAAQKACDFIESGMVVGLGGGQTILYLIEEIKQRNLDIQVVIPSSLTKQACLKQAIPVLEVEDVSQLDIAFDGCDEIDAQLNALKSGGGIHTREKLVAKMAKQYLLLADNQKYAPILPFAHPICLEVLPSAKSYVMAQFERLGLKVVLRQAANKVGWQISDDGNYLMDVFIQPVADLSELNTFLNELPGVIGHSLFYQVATQAIIADENQVKRIVRKAS